MSSVFSKIIKREIPADIVFENEKVMVIKDIDPKAPVHLLIIPKKEVSDFQSMSVDDYPLLEEVARVAQQLAREYKIEKGYRLLINNGPDAGQTIWHLHFHLLGGRRLGIMG